MGERSVRNAEVRGSNPLISTTSPRTGLSIVPRLYDPIHFPDPIDTFPMKRSASVERRTTETDIALTLGVDGTGQADISTGIPFFDHMLTLFAVHGLFDLTLNARGDLEVDGHHTVEDVGLVMGDALDQALADRRGIRRYGHAVVPMDEALAAVTVDLSRRPFLVYTPPEPRDRGGVFDVHLAKEFFRAFVNRGGLNLHIDIRYGENGHHMLEAVFKALGRSLDEAVAVDARISGVRSSKGSL